MISNLHPGLLLMAFGIIILILPEKFRKFLMIAGSVSAALSFFTLNSSSVMEYKITDGLTLELLEVDGLSRAFVLIFVVIALICAIYSLELQNKVEAAFSAFYAGSMIGVVLAGDYISLIFFWEISAFASMYLIYAKHCRKSSRAAFRYILVHSFGGNMLLAGILVQVYHQGIDITNIASQNDIAFWLILIGVAVNAAIPPLNGWLADAYPEATITGAVYMGSYTTKAAIYVMIRLFAGVEFLIYVGAFMAVFAACMAIMENDLRRLLSYHIISQLGMMVAALAVGTQIGVDGAVAHVVTNILFKGVLLMGAGAVIYATGKRKILELGGLYKKMPLVAICFLISSLAIAGLPFLSGFASKALIMESLTESVHPFAALMITAAGVGTLLSITLKINYFVFFGKSEIENEVKPIPKSMSIAMVAGTVLSVLLGVVPRLLYSYTAYSTMINPFTFGHIMEYVAIFIGGTIPFIIFIKIMKPHDNISMDFDWFYRRPLNSFITFISKKIHGFTLWFDKITINAVSSLRVHLGNPYLWTENSGIRSIKTYSFENEERAVGDIIQVSISTFAVIMIIIVFYK